MKKHERQRRQLVNDCRKGNPITLIDMFNFHLDKQFEFLCYRHNSEVYLAVSEKFESNRYGLIGRMGNQNDIQSGKSS